MHYIYKITNQLNGKIYIGQSNKETERWRQHKYFARQDEPVQYISRAMKKYGVENFNYEVIDFAFNQWQADCLELNYIQQLDTRNKEKGYNISLGGDPAWNRGLPKEQQPMYGKHHTIESRKKSSKSNTGIKKAPHTEEWKQQASMWLTGRLVSKKSLERLAEYNRTKILSEETIKNMAKGHRKFTDEQENEIIQLRKSGTPVKEIMTKFSCSDKTIYNIVNKKGITR